MRKYIHFIKELKFGMQLKQRMTVIVLSFQVIKPKINPFIT